MTPEDKATLMPCPCCGSEAALAEIIYDDKRKGYLVICPDCQLQTVDVHGGDHMDGDVEYSISLEQAKSIVIARWNRRVGVLTVPAAGDMKRIPTSTDAPPDDIFVRLERLTYELHDLAALLSMAQDGMIHHSNGSLFAKVVNPVLEQLERLAKLAHELLDDYLSRERRGDR